MRDWEPPSHFREKLRYGLVPPRLSFTYRAHRELRKGKHELRLLPCLLQRDKNSVDVGANKGVYTYWMQKYSRYVYAYEPNPKMFRILKAGARGNVTVSPVALSNTTGAAKLRIPKTARGFSDRSASLNYEVVGPTYGEVEIEKRRLDDENVREVCFMKIDVEGREFAVLEGARDVIDRDRPSLLIEIVEAYNRMPIEESLARVTDLGYRGFAFIDAALKSLDFFDPEAHHRAPRERKDFVCNFLFLPRK